MTKNPIITGFNPDPSIIRVKDDYYIACSTFEWFPGVQIHHSRDLVNWKLITRPLDHVRLLDMRGVPDSCGVWAPCLSYQDGTFYLVYSNVKSFDGLWKDTPNYLVTSKNIKGPWSDPIFLSSKGFDGSLFHDDDGRKYYLSLVVDHRDGKFFGGIMIQEYDSKFKCLSGKAKYIFYGSDLGITEGPHLYKKDGYYYLLTAEGGTEYGHAVTICRSKDIFGPYELHPDNPILSASGKSEHPIQRSGHGDFTWTKDDRCFLVYLGSRPLMPEQKCTLGRETCIDEIHWPEGEWPSLKSGLKLPSLDLANLPLKDAINEDELIDFSKDDKLSISYQSLRVPIDTSWVNLNMNRGILSLKGRDSLASCFDQSLLARRVKHFNIDYEVSLSFEPESFQQMAGLVCYYNTGHHYYLHLMGDDLSDKKYINLIQTDKFESTELLENYIDVSNQDLVHFKVEWRSKLLAFYYSLDGLRWILLKDKLDACILSDDHVREGSDRYQPAFTGSFVGIACQDLCGLSIQAHFLKLFYKSY